VGRRNNAVIKSMLENVAALGADSTDDPRVVVYGANSIGPNNKLFPRTSSSWPTPSSRGR